MPQHIALPPYDRYGISTFVVSNGQVQISHFGATKDADGQRLTTIEAQTAETFAHLRDALGEIGLGLQDMLKVTVILRNIEDFNGMHRAWLQYFPENAPARTTITSAFVSEAVLIQIDGVAASR
ncbi:MAG: reactive intermediate/imine deaminase [Candidatus Dactylopiibacterium carminicum]|uniref:Reactive intermediate/imine deaminase n=1 Tax=Candidatus Dactylopiibacterium carminicum TaxID=857335 RepID=A0A272ETD9_9RHOO|nr:RidA family protein [Candidatus Dactylopiibacterium carminicum]KAF7599360.1 RidA family protein [Candidatus Dactylopiibacterium carminicum]PAS93369.1 MAG: reactive intermediate/imine deaminase [Candidatus Dactylopiibacterium carminicum]PAS98323.1 MAG: reactive intermediate/imine deaminase [Candidatus Dactylopiibacterium carminicum]PAS99368.1 MAG: hypothetical protein BSR46_08360 [Candidatus Dactylopiibacterium carminicum]